MTTENMTTEIRDALSDLSQDDPIAGARRLLETLGYRSDRTLELTGSVSDFIKEFPAPNPDTLTERDFRQNVASVHVVFQITNTEISESVNAQGGLFTASSFDEGDSKSFVFSAVQLKDGTYPRGDYAKFTREINKRLSQPTVVLFKTAENLLTLAFVHRRKRKRDQSRNVLGSVSLIREIDIAHPHRAHLDILAKLALPERLKWMNAHHMESNFDGLLDAWLDALDTEELNRSFYRQLFTWFERAVKEARFPINQTVTLSSEEHIIRLITRLLFVWFIKEKGLIAPELFTEVQVKSLLREYDRDFGDSYYRAILQNLFFATLNSEIKGRRFSRKSSDDHREPSYYRFKEEIADPDRLLELFGQTPFINGGLFDCLDSPEAPSEGGYRIDCFSDNVIKSRGDDSGILSIPNHLFFGEEGLISLFERFQFTVEENTPAEQEVALDPELLGKVFENLLAAYNPETRETARKQTGSYYTPREVVDYMVDQALIASLAQKCPPSDGDTEYWEKRLSFLLDFEDDFDGAHDLFEESEKEGLVRAIASLKLLDPAVGSGAFPMGALHKLTLALRRLDSQNKLWKSLQTELAKERASKAFDTDDKRERDAELKEISDTFEKFSDSDFGRKLYLIQNSIYGVDIQPVACQIAKLRFFISLAIEQKRDPKAENFGIRPLPNLETKFVAANTLIDLDLAYVESLLQEDEVQQLRRKIAVNREKYFLPSSRRQKVRYIREGKRLRKQLKQVLRNKRAQWEKSQQSKINRMVAQIPNTEQRKRLKTDLLRDYATRKREFFSSLDEAQEIAQWTPFDQNAKTDWFNAKHMFGVSEGFDIVIGNPPYVRADSGTQHLMLRQRIENSKRYETLWEKWDLFIPFMERSFELLKIGGFTSLIVSDAYCHSKYAQKSQKWFLKNSRILRLDFLSRVKIFDAAVRNMSYLIQKSEGSDQEPERRVHYPDFGTVVQLPTKPQRELTYRSFFPEDANLHSFSVPTIQLDKICYISVGMAVHAHEDLAPGMFELRDLVSDLRDELHPKPFVEGKHLDKWLPMTVKWLEWGTERAPGLFRRKTFPELHQADEKILVQRSPGPDPKACYDDFQLHFTESSVGFLLWRSLSGVKNRSIKKQTRYSDELPRRPDLPRREELEAISLRFDVKFLLGVMNSTAAHNYLKSIRRSNIHLYPKDWRSLPIPDVSPEQQTPIVHLVNRILQARKCDTSADILDLEKELDELVCGLYGITDEVAEAVEGQS